MKVGWQPESEMEPAKYLWSSSQVSPGQHSTSPHPSSKQGLAALYNDWMEVRSPSLWPRALIYEAPLDWALVRMLHLEQGSQPVSNEGENDALTFPLCEK